MAKEWTDEEVTQQIKEAVEIVREDRLESFLRGRFGAPSNDPNGGNDPSKNDGKDGGNPNPDGSSNKKRSLWWGETE